MMRLPHTDNAEHLWAFKKGYRFAQQGKPLREMPMTIRIDPTLRDYFQQGYDQAQQQLAQQQGPELTPKKRALWLVLTLIAGLATAKLMIDRMQAEAPAPSAPPLPDLAEHQAPAGTQEKALPNPTPSPTHSTEPVAGKADGAPSPAAITGETDSEAEPQTLSLNTAAQTGQRESAQPQPTPATTETGHDGQTPEQAMPDKPDTAVAASETPDFSLLDAEARAKRLQLLETDTALPPVVPSDIRIERAVLAAGIIDREPVGVLDDVVPKSMRRVVFFTEIKGAKGRTLTHRWRWGTRVMAEVKLPIGSDDFRTWSSKRMSAAWAGRWWVEVVDDKGQVIARKGFRYVR